MGRKRGRKNRNKGFALSGVSSEASTSKRETLKDTLIKGTLLIASGIAAAGAGAALGKHSFAAGFPIVYAGAWLKNKYVTAAGLGLVLANGFQKPAQPTPAAQSIEGFDLKQIATEAKDRVGNFFENFKEKLYLSKSQPDNATAGLGENGEQVTYFVNPYSSNELDMSAIDRIQEQIAEMNKPGATSGLSEIEREF